MTKRQSDMVTCWVHGTPVPLAASNSHHVTPKGAGGADGSRNEIRICTNCHSVLHRAEELNANGKGSQVPVLIAAAFVGTGQRKRMGELVRQASLAFQDAEESGFTKDEVQVTLSRDLFERLQVLAQGVRDPLTRRRVGVGRYVEGILRGHVRSKGMTISEPVKGR